MVAAAAIPVLMGLALAPLLGAQGSPGWIDEASLVGRVAKAPAVFIVGFEAPAPYLVTGVAAVICASGSGCSLPGRRLAAAAAACSRSGLALHRSRSL